VPKVSVGDYRRTSSVIGTGLFQFAHRVLHVTPADDRVSFKNAAGLPSSDLHDDALRYSGTSKIAGSRTPEFVEYATRVPELFMRRKSMTRFPVLTAVLSAPAATISRFTVAALAEFHSMSTTEGTSISLGQPLCKPSTSSCETRVLAYHPREYLWFFARHQGHK
jgi:hypothetical protein